MIIESIHWDEAVGSCVKHLVPQVPCPTCLVSKDPDVQVMIEESDRNFLDWEGMAAEQAGEIPPTVSDLLPAEHPWLEERIINLY